MKTVGAGLTDIGQRRQENQDHFFCDASAGLFIVADGMGGRGAGETASNVVITVLPIMLNKRLTEITDINPNVITLLLHETLCQLSHDLYQHAQTKPTLVGIGSTAVVLFVWETVAYIAYAGDSRGYLLRDAELLQITDDQTTAAALVRLGQLTAEEAEQHPLRHALEEYIGKEGELKPGVRCKKVHAGDRWLLCSDGLTKGIPDHALRELLLQYPFPEEVCRKLIATAKEADGTDNITAVVIDIIENETQTHL